MADKELKYFIRPVRIPGLADSFQLCRRGGVTLKGFDTIGKSGDLVDAKWICISLNYADTEYPMLFSNMDNWYEVRLC